jgi:hypothetical protein
VQAEMLAVTAEKVARLEIARVGAEQVRDFVEKSSCDLHGWLGLCLVRPIGYLDRIVGQEIGFQVVKRLLSIWAALGRKYLLALDRDVFLACFRHRTTGLNFAR